MKKVEKEKKQSGRKSKIEDEGSRLKKKVEWKRDEGSRVKKKIRV